MRHPLVLAGVAAVVATAFAHAAQPPAEAAPAAAPIIVLKAARLAVPRDPLADIRQTKKVMFVLKGGVIHRHDSAAAR